MSFPKADFRGNGVVWLWEGSGRRQLCSGLAQSARLLEHMGRRQDHSPARRLLPRKEHLWVRQVLLGHVLPWKGCFCPQRHGRTLEGPSSHRGHLAALSPWWPQLLKVIHPERPRLVRLEHPYPGAQPSQGTETKILEEARNGRMEQELGAVGQPALTSPA